MSTNDFFGRPISKGMDDLEFDLCEVCERRSPSWLEVQYQNNQAIVRFTCTECHEDYLEIRSHQSEELARQIDEEEDLPESTRPGWVDDFISEQAETGTIDSIDTVEQTKEVEEEEITFSEPPENFQEQDNELETKVEHQQQQIANWAPKFIQEALFGPNPEQWLEEKGGYQKENLDLTVKTLGSFADHNVNSVKLSAIQCLTGLYNRYSSYKGEVLDHLGRYQLDEDDTVADFANQTISQIK